MVGGNFNNKCLYSRAVNMPYDFDVYITSGYSSAHAHIITCAILDHDRAELYPLGRIAVAATKDQMVRKLRPLSHLVMISSLVD
jgi:hypothetical protein